MSIRAVLGMFATATLTLAISAPADAQHRSRAHPARVTRPATTAHPARPAARPARRGRRGHEDPNVAQARRESEQGTQSLQAGHPAEALPHLQHAFELHPDPVVLLSIAQAQQQVGQVPAAIATLERYLQMRADAPDRAEVEARITEWRRTPATLQVTSTPPGAHIIVDGQDTGRLAPSEVTVPGGRHEVRLEMDGYLSATQSFDVEPTGRHDVASVLPAIPPPVASPEPSPAPPILPPPAAIAVEPAPAHGVSGGTITAFSIAGATLIGGGVLGGLALADMQSFTSSPNATTADRGDAEALAADICFGVAIAATAIGVIVYFAHDRAPQERHAQTLRPQRPMVHLAPTGFAVVF